MDAKTFLNELAEYADERGDVADATVITSDGGRPELGVEFRDGSLVVVTVEEA